MYIPGQVPDTAVQVELEAVSRETQLLQENIDAASGGGFTPAIFYALGSGSANLGTSLGTVPLAAASISDTGYSLASNEVTIAADLDGKNARVDWSVGGTGATNRVEIRSELQVDPDGLSGYSAVKSGSNYTARNGTQNTGGVHGYHYLALATGMKLRIQALRDGSTANLVANATSLSIETKT